MKKLFAIGMSILLGLSAMAGIKTDTIDEQTSGAGVTVDGVLIKDDTVTADNIVTDIVYINEAVELTPVYYPSSETLGITVTTSNHTLAALDSDTKEIASISGGDVGAISWITNIGKAAESSSYKFIDCSNMLSGYNITCPGNADFILSPGDSVCIKRESSASWTIISIAKPVSSSGSVSDTAWTGENWTSDTVAPSQSAVQGALDSTLNPGMWKLVERKTVTGSAVTSLTFSELDGDADVRYQVIFILISGVTGDKNVHFRFNGDATTSNYATALNNGTPYNFTNMPGIQCANTVGSGYISIGESLIFAVSGIKRNIQGVARSENGSGGTAMVLTGEWKNTADNITSISIVHDTASGIAVGSYVELWKLAQ